MAFFCYPLLLLFFSSLEEKGFVWKSAIVDFQKITNKDMCKMSLH